MDFFKFFRSFLYKNFRGKSDSKQKTIYNIINNDKQIDTFFTFDLGRD